MQQPRLSNRLTMALGALVILMPTLIFFMYSRDRALKEVYSVTCVGNLKQIGLALVSYESTYGSLPPSYFADAKGRPLYSWRVALMAHLENISKVPNNQEFTKDFRFDEPWDSPNNRKTHNRRPWLFFCPSQPENEGKGFSSYLAVVGPGTLFPPRGQTKRLKDIRSDPEGVWMVVESQNSSIHWMEPRDLIWDKMSFQIDDPSMPSISSNHYSGSYAGAHAVTAADTVSTLSNRMSQEYIKIMLNVDKKQLNAEINDTK